MTKENKHNGAIKEVDGIDLLKGSIKKSLYKAVGTAIDDETQRATEEMAEIRKDAIKQIAEEERNVIQKIIEDEKKSIWERVFEAQQSDVLSAEKIKEDIAEAFITESSNEDEGNDNITISGTTENKAENKDVEVIEKVELEILPPRDQNEIAAINTYLINMAEVSKVELCTLVDKSIFKVQLNTPVNFIEKLVSLPQILNAEEVVDEGKKRITITLFAKSKLENNFVNVNDRVNKIFHKK